MTFGDLTLPAVADGSEEKMAKSVMLWQISSSGDYVYIVLENVTSADSHSIIFRRSNDTGRTFEPIKTIFNFSSAQQILANPHIVSLENNIYIAWNVVSESDPNSSRIMLAKSADYGMTFNDPVKLEHNSASTSTSNLEEFVIDDGNKNNIYLVYKSITLDEEIGLPRSSLFFIGSVDGGDSFSDPIELNMTKNGSDGDSVYAPSAPRLVVHANNVFIVWIEMEDHGPEYDFLPRKFNIILTRSQDYGDTFADRVVLGSGNFTSGIPPVPQIDLSSDGRNVFVAWHDMCNGRCRQVFFTQSFNAGMTFETPAELNNIVGISFSTNQSSFPNIKQLNPHPFIAASSDDAVFVLWQGLYEEGKNDMVLVRIKENVRQLERIDNSEVMPWKKSIHLTPVQLTTDGTNANVLWFGSLTENDINPSYDLFFVRVSGTQLGKVFNLTDGETGFIIDSNTSPLTGLTKMISSDNYIYVSWQDNILDNSRELFFRASTDGGNSFGDAIQLNNKPMATIPEFGQSIFLIVVSLAVLLGYYALANRFR